MSAPRPLAREVSVALGLGLVVLVMGFLPWHPMVDVFPHGSDATKWVQESHPSQPGWFRYVFLTRHFIGYRPVAALTYTLDGLVAGWQPWAYRLTDIVLHGLVGVLLFYVYRALTGDRSAWGLLAPVLFFLHPATEDVVPHLARRSYSLSCALSLAGVLAFVPAARRPERPLSPHTWLATLLLLLAVLSNEVAGVVVALLPILALHLRPSGDVPIGRSLVTTAPTLIGTVFLLAVRVRLIGYAGGYHKRYFAYAQNDRNLLREVDDTPYAQIIEAAWQYAAFPSSATGTHPLLFGSAVGLALAFAVVVFYGWFAVALPALAWRDERARLPGVLFVWILGYSLLYALTRNWFWRQGYPMLMPLALLVPVVARQLWERRDERPSLVAAAFAVPQAALVLSLAWHSPAVRGLERGALGGPLKTSAVIHDVHAMSSVPLEEPALVYVAVPTRAGNAHSVRIWSRLLAEPRRVSYKLLAVSRPTASVELDDTLLTVSRRGDRLWLELAPGMTWSEVTGSDLEAEDASGVWLDALHTPGIATYVYWREGGVGRLERVPEPATELRQSSGIGGRARARGRARSTPPRDVPGDGRERSDEEAGPQDGQPHE